MRQKMHRVVGLVVVLAIVGTARVPAQVGTPPAPTPNPPAILSAVLSADLSTLTLTGLHLGTGTPAVSLAATSLPVTGATPTAVTARLPAGLQAGTYLLALTRAGDRAMALFYLSVGVVATGTPIPGTKQEPSESADSRSGQQQPASQQADSASSESATPPAPAAAAESDASGNTGYGTGSLAGKPGTHNTAFGYQTGAAITGKVQGQEGVFGKANTLVGYASGRRLRTGRYNTFVGSEAGDRTETGSSNTFIGYRAGLNAFTGSNNNIYVGHMAGAINSFGSFNIYLGHGGIARESKTIRIGQPGFQTATYLVGAVHAPSFVGDGSKLTGVVAVYQ